MPQNHFQLLGVHGWLLVFQVSFWASGHIGSILPLYTKISHSRNKFRLPYPAEYTYIRAGCEHWHTTSFMLCPRRWAMSFVGRNTLEEISQKNGMVWCAMIISKPVYLTLVYGSEMWNYTCDTVVTVVCRVKRRPTWKSHNHHHVPSSSSKIRGLHFSMQQINLLWLQRLIWNQTFSMNENPRIIYR